MGGSGGGWTPTAPSNPCERLNFRADIASPQPAAISSLQVGQKLVLSLIQGASPSVHVLNQSSIVGTLTGPNVPRLIQCMMQGFIFEADVVALNGGLCTVQVHSI